MSIVDIEQYRQMMLYDIGKYLYSTHFHSYHIEKFINSTYLRMLSMIEDESTLQNAKDVQMPWMIKQKRERAGTGWCERNRWIRWCNNRFMRSVDMIFLVVRLIFSTLFTSVLVVCHAFSQAAVTNEMIPNEMGEGSQTWFWGISAIQNISVIYFITRKKQKLLFGNQFERNFTQHLRRNMFASWKICYLFFNFELIDYNDVDEEQKIGGAKLRIV